MRRMTLQIGVSYAVPPNRVKQVMAQCAQNVPGISLSPVPAVNVVSFEDSAILYALYYW